MAGNSPIRYGKIRRALERGGAKLLAVNGSHHNWSFRSRIFALPVHGNQVKAGYIKRLRQKWQLTVADGVSDDDFWDGNWA